MISERVALGGETQPVSLLDDFLESHHVQDRRGLVRFLLQQRDAEKAANRMLWWNRPKTRGVCRSSIGMRDDFDLHAVRIGKGQDLLFEPLPRLLDDKALIGQPL